MGVWPTIGPVVPPFIGPWFCPPFTTFLVSQSLSASAAWGTNNLAFYYPLWLPHPCTVTKLFWQNGTVVAGTVDVAVYNGSGNQLVSAANPSQAGISAIQSVDVTDTVIGPGVVFLAISASASTATFWMSGASPVMQGWPFSIKKQTTANPLPATATMAVGDLAPFPKFGALIAPRTVL